MKARQRLPLSRSVYTIQLFVKVDEPKCSLHVRAICYCRKDLVT